MTRLFLFTLVVFPLSIMAQNVGIGTTDPVTRLQVEEGHVLFFASGLVSSETPVFTPPVFGRYLLWQVNKGALRTGLVFGDDLDEAKIGNYTFASGEKNEASGQWAAAMGYGNRAAESGAIAMGYQCEATGLYSIAAGSLSKAIGASSVTLGEGCIASGAYAAAMGNSNLAQGRGSVALGFQNSTWACGSFVAGLYNDTTHAGSEIFPQPPNRIFQVGNGTSGNVRSNALTILQNGNTGIGVLEPAEKLVVAGNAAFAGNITVQNGKGIIQTADNSQLKKITAVVAVNGSFGIGETRTFSITWPETFNGNVEAYVGNIVDGSAGGWAGLIMSIAAVTNAGATLYVYNPFGSAYHADYAIKIVAMGQY